MKSLIIDQTVRDKIAAVVKFAEEHPQDVATIKYLIQTGIAAADVFHDLRCVIPMGYRVVLTIEEQPFGWCRHLSVSLEGHPCPSPAAVDLIAEQFGFRRPLSENIVFTEGYGNGKVAVNVIEPMTD